jgi:hypothetical protein
MIDELSKREFEALGCADVPGKQLRARVFNLEGLASEMALALQDVVNSFFPTDDGLNEAEIACADRAREALLSATEYLVKGED